MMNRAMQETLKEAMARLTIEEDQLAKIRGRLETEFRTWLREKAGIALPDDVRVEVFVNRFGQNSPYDIRFVITPRPDLPAFTVELRNRVEMVKGRVMVTGKSLLWRGNRGGHSYNSSDFEATVRFALTGSSK